MDTCTGVHTRKVSCWAPESGDCGTQASALQQPQPGSCAAAQAAHPEQDALRRHAGQHGAAAEHILDQAGAVHDLHLGVVRRVLGELLHPLCASVCQPGCHQPLISSAPEAGSTAGVRGATWVPDLVQQGVYPAQALQRQAAVEGQQLNAPRGRCILQLARQVLLGLPSTSSLRAPGRWPASPRPGRPPASQRPIWQGPQRLGHRDICHSARPGTLPGARATATVYVWACSAAVPAASCPLCGPIRPGTSSLRLDPCSGQPCAWTLVHRRPGQRSGAESDSDSLPVAADPSRFEPGRAGWFAASWRSWQPSSAGRSTAQASRCQVETDFAQPAGLPALALPGAPPALCGRVGHGGCRFEGPQAESPAKAHGRGR